MSNINSVRNPENAASWRSRRRGEGWVFVQFWARPPVAEKLQELVDRARVVVPDAKPKEILEDLILHAK